MTYTLFGIVGVYWVVAAALVRGGGGGEGGLCIAGFGFGFGCGCGCDFVLVVAAGQRQALLQRPALLSSWLALLLFARGRRG